MKNTQTDTETNPKIKAGDTCWPCRFQTHRTQAQFVKKEIQDRKIQKKHKICNRMILKVGQVATDGSNHSQHSPTL